MAAQRVVKLDRMRALLAALDHPERAFPSVLVAGTKGKGSTVAMIAACVQSAALRTGRYTSPHLINWRERTCIDAEPISTDAVIALAEPIRAAIAQLDPALGSPTTFEVGTLFAFIHFAQQRVDLAVVEVGTGGRFDATNLLEPLVSAITPISYDHTATLGGTLREIAWHKAGILRAARPGIVAPQPDEARRAIERAALAIGAKLDEVGRDWWWSATPTGIRVESSRPEFASIDATVGLLGDHQRDNATSAVAVVHALRPLVDVPVAAIQTGLAHVDWPGRLQVLGERPLVVLDGAHNAASAAVVRATLDRELHFERLLIVLGLTADKDARGVIDALTPGAAAIYLTRSQHERSAPPTELEPLVRSVAPDANVTLYDELPTAADAALRTARADDLVLIVGSLFLVGEALVWWRRSPR